MQGRTNAPGAGGSPRRSRRARKPLRASLRKQGGALLLALGLAGSALAFGAQQTTPLVLAALTAVLAGVLMPVSRTPRAVWLLVGLAGYALVQIIPLPFGWVERLSPHAASVWQGCLTPFGLRPPSWVTLSVEPAATALEALKWGAYACLLSAATSLRARHGSVPLAVIVVGCGSLVALVTLVHGVLDAEHIYGVYNATDPSRWTRGPFVNGNNLSGYLNVGVFAGAGLWLTRRGRARIVLGVAVLLMAAGSLLAGSRGGTAALALGVPMFAALSLRPGAPARGRVAISVASASLGAIALAGMMGDSRIWQTFGDTQFRAKVSVWRWTLGMIADFPVFGVGRGAFETAFQPYRAPLGNDWTLVFAHAENFPLQWAADWGLPVALVALVGLAAGMRTSIAHARRSPIAAGLATGLAALLLQNFADLGLEVYAIAALAVVAFAGASPAVEITERSRPWSTAGVLTLGAAMVVVGTHASLVQLERGRAASAFNALKQANRAEIVSFQRGLEPVVRAHPGESYFPLLGGLAAARVRQNPLPWLGRALERSPLDARVHLALSDALAARGARQQALLHARLAAVYDVTLRTPALERVARTIRTADDIAAAFPERLPGEGLVAELCSVLPPELVVPCWREAARRSNSPDAQRGLASALVDALEHGAAPCAGPGVQACTTEADQALARLGDQAFAARWQIATIRARLMAFQGDPSGAAAALLKYCPATNEAADCCQQALELAARSRNLEAIAAAATRYTAVVCGDPGACASVHERVGRVYEGLGAHALALSHFTRAAEQAPNAERWLLVAETAATAGSNVKARLALDRANKEGAEEPQQRARIAAIEDLLTARQLQ